MRKHHHNTASLHYPFGLDMMSYSNPEFSYTYDFNGKPTDEEIGWQDYGNRMYHKGIIRFPSPDPLIVKAQEYPELSPYQFASNTPIQAIDLDGLEAVIILGGPNMFGGSVRTPQQNLTTAWDITKYISESTIDGFTHLSTRLGASFLNGISYGYGDFRYDNGSATNLELGYFRFNWKEGFNNPGYRSDNSISLSNNSHSVSYEDGKSIMSTITTIVLFPIKAITPLEKLVKFSIKPLLKAGLNSLDNNSEQTQNLIKTHNVTGDGVRIRSGAGTENAVLGLLYTGDGVIATGNTDGEWSEVTTNNGTTGFVHTSFLNQNQQSTEN